MLFMVTVLAGNGQFAFILESDCLHLMRTCLCVFLPLSDDW